MFVFENLIFFVKFPARIPQTATTADPRTLTKKNLKKQKISYIIYIESERRNQF